MILLVNQPICGNVKTRTDAKGKVTTMAYDGQNRLVSTTDRGGGVTRNNYDYCQLVSLVDAENQMTAYAYKPLSGFGFSTGATGYDDEDRVKNWNRADGNQNQAWSLSLVGDWKG